MDLDGSKRASILLLSLGQERAGEVLKFFDPRDVQVVGSTMSTLGTVTPEMVDSVLEDFIIHAKNCRALGSDPDAYIRDMLTNALGAEKAGTLVKRISMGASSKGIGQLKWMDSRTIADLVRLEHPQIIAIVLSLLDADQAAEVLGYLPKNIISNLLTRVATLESIQPAALRELDKIMDLRLSGSEGAKSAMLGGIDKVASMMNYMEGSVSDVIMEEIAESNADLAQQIQDKLFVFADLEAVDDRSIQTLLREISSDQLLLALRGVNDELKEKIFKNMSKRGAEMLRDDLAASAPAKLSDVENAQKEILAIARRLSDAGQITLAGAGGGEALV